MEKGMADRVLRELQAWAGRYWEGTVRLVGFNKPRLSAGERWAMRTMHVGRSGVDRRDVAELTRAPIARIEGLGFATSERILISQGRHVKHVWNWRDLYSVKVLPGWQGLLLDRGPDTDELDVIATEPSAFAAAPKPEHVVVSWLKAEGAFADFRGELQSWVEALPARLSSSRSG